MSVGIAGAIHRQSNRAEAMIILGIDKIGIFDRGRFHIGGKRIAAAIGKVTTNRGFRGKNPGFPLKLFSTDTTSLLVTKEMGYYN